MDEYWAFHVQMTNDGIWFFSVDPEALGGDPLYGPGLYLFEAHFIEEESGLRAGRSPRYEARGFVVAPDIDEAKRLGEQFRQGEIPCVVHPAQVTFVESWPKVPERQDIVVLMDRANQFLRECFHQE